MDTLELNWVKHKMNKQDLIDLLLKEQEIDSIQIEDYRGETLIFLDFWKMDIADVEGKTIRLQMNIDNE